MEVPREETEVGAREQPEKQGKHELRPEPDLEIPVIPEDPERMKEYRLRSIMKTRRGRPGRKKC